MRKEGARLIIETVPPGSLLAVLARLTPIEGAFPPIDDSHPEAVSLDTLPAR